MVRFTTLAVLCVSLCLFGVSPTAAEWDDGDWGGGYDSDYSDYSGGGWNYYQPSYSSYAQPYSYVQPSYSQASFSAPVYAPQPANITISNPTTNGIALSYMLDGQVFTMQPGQIQKLERTATIDFNRGGAFGNARYSLTDGVYTFTPSGIGWELYHRAP
jgi:hypothetical protein